MWKSSKFQVPIPILQIVMTIIVNLTCNNVPILATKMQHLGYVFPAPFATGWYHGFEIQVFHAKKFIAACICPY